MTFARVASSRTQVAATGAANALTLPSGVMAGDLLVCFAVSRVSTTAITVSVGTWTTVSTEATTMYSAIFARIATGTSADQITLNKAADDWCVTILRIVDHGVTTIASDIKVGTWAVATALDPDSPSLNAGSTADWLWLAEAGIQYTATGSVFNAAPANYTMVSNIKSASSTTSCGLAVAQRSLNTQTEDPGVWDTNLGSTRPCRAQTIAIPGGTPRSGARTDLCESVASSLTTVILNTPTFVPVANSVLLAVCCIGNTTGIGTLTGTVTDSLSSGWTKLDEYQAASGSGMVQIWAQDIGASPATRVVTLTTTTTIGMATVIALYSLLGTQATASILGTVRHSTANLESDTINVSTANSLVFGAFSDANGTGTATPLSGEMLDLGLTDATNGEKYAIFHAANVVATGNFTFGVGTITGSQSSMAAWELKAAGGGATDYTQTATDAEGITDSRTVAQVAARSGPDELLGITDQFTQTIGLVVVLTDSIGMLDSITQTTGYTATQTDAVGVLDSQTRASVASQTVTDAEGITDPSLVRASVVSQAATDAVGITDPSLARVSVVTQSLTDPIGLVDSQSQTGAYAPTITDTEGLVDSRTQAAASTRAQTDALGIADTYGAGVTRSLTDGFGIVDPLTSVNGAALTTTDSLGLLDSLSSATGRPLTDSIATTDTTTQAAVFFKTQVDPFGLADAESGALARPVADPLGVADVAIQTTGFTQTAIDPLGLVDSKVDSMADARTVVDTVGTLDSTVQVSASARTQTDAVTLPDSAGQAAATAQAITDPLATTDSVIAINGTLQVITDILGLTDSHAEQFGLAMSLTDPVGMADGLTLAATVVLTLTDALATLDSTALASDVVQEIVDLVGAIDDTLTSSEWAVLLTDLISVNELVDVGGLIRFITDAYWGADLTNA